MNKTYFAFAALVVCALVAIPASAQDNEMSFFVTSTNPGNGADFGGLAGADAHCQSLAAAAGAGGKTWQAYLGTSSPLVHARDRIGEGPWYNVNGDAVAQNLDDLHFNNMNLNKEMSLSESGGTINGVGDQPNQHDILTGSNPDGTSSGENCNNWTSSGEDSTATLGHLDRVGRGGMGPSWVTAHPSRGCSNENLAASGGGGFIYCFAID
jgi:hypothetical protein